MKRVAAVASDAHSKPEFTKLKQAILPAEGTNGYLTYGSVRRAMSIADFCRLYGVGRTTTYAQIKAGKLKALKVGRRTVVPVDAAETWLVSLSLPG